MAQSRSRDNIENVRQLRVGAHVLNKSYSKGDIVTFGNNMYIAIQKTAVTPPNATDWKIMDRGGIKWDIYTQYQTGDIISYNGDIYVVGATPPPVGTLPTDPAFSDPINANTIVFSEDGTGGHPSTERIARMVSISSAEYNAMTSREDDCLYVIKG